MINGNELNKHKFHLFIGITFEEQLHYQEFMDRTEKETSRAWEVESIYRISSNIWHIMGFGCSV